MLGDGGSSLLGAFGSLACPASERRFAGRLSVLLSALGIGEVALDAGAVRVDEICILVPAARVLARRVPVSLLTRIGSPRDEINALGLGDAPGAALPDAEGEADAFGVSLVAQGRDDPRIEFRRYGAGHMAAVGMFRIRVLDAALAAGKTGPAAVGRGTTYGRRQSRRRNQKNDGGKAEVKQQPILIRIPVSYCQGLVSQANA
jgi:hypothetical protein